MEEEVNQAQQELSDVSVKMDAIKVETLTPDNSKLELSMYKDLTGLIISDIREEMCDIEGEDEETIVKPMTVYYCRQVGTQGGLLIPVLDPLIYNQIYAS